MITYVEQLYVAVVMLSVRLSGELIQHVVHDGHVAFDHRQVRPQLARLTIRQCHLKLVTLVALVYQATDVRISC